MDKVLPVRKENTLTFSQAKKLIDMALGRVSDEEAT